MKNSTPPCNVFPKKSVYINENRINALEIVHRNSEETKHISRAKAHCPQAQHWLFSRYAPKMLRLCHTYIGNRESAEEILLDAFFKAFTKIDQFTSKGAFEGWVRKIVIRECLTFLRRKNKEQSYLNDLPETFVTDKTNAAAGEADAIFQVIEQLPEHHRTVFLLHALEGYSHKEIARCLSISENTSKSRLLRARKSIQKRLKKIHAHGTTAL